MATIRKRSDKWQVQVRRQGHSAQSRTFTLKSDALTWARQIEADADKQSLPVDPQQLKRITVTDLIERYRDTITPRKRGQEVETIRLNVFMRHDFSTLTLAQVTSMAFARFRDQRLAQVGAGTVIKELSLLQSVFEVARREWDIPLLSNPLSTVRKPSAPKARERRLEAGELDVLIGGCTKCRNKLIKPLILLAIETGMRRGELLNIHKRDINFDQGTLHIPQTKNGHPRTIPLTEPAKLLLKSLSDSLEGGRVLPLTIESVKLAWCRLVRRSELNDLHFHDLRHEAISRFFEMGLSVPEVALISGHRDPRMLFRYTHLRAEDLSTKIQRITTPMTE